LINVRKDATNKKVLNRNLNHVVHFYLKKDMMNIEGKKIVNALPILKTKELLAYILKKCFMFNSEKMARNLILGEIDITIIF